MVTQDPYAPLRIIALAGDPRVGLFIWALAMAHPQHTAVPTPRTTREIHLQQQVDVLLSKQKKAAEIHERQVAALKQALSTAHAHTLEVENASGRRRAQLDEVSRKLAAALRERPILIARIEAGIERRREMAHVLYALLTCEDDPALTDKEHDKRMDEIVKRARTLVDAERAAVLRGEGQS